MKGTGWPVEVGYAYGLTVPMLDFFNLSLISYVMLLFALATTMWLCSIFISGVVLVPKRLTWPDYDGMPDTIIS